MKNYNFMPRTECDTAQSNPWISSKYSCFFICKVFDQQPLQGIVEVYMNNTDDLIHRKNAFLSV